MVHLKLPSRLCRCSCTTQLYLFGGKSGLNRSLVPRYLFTTKFRFKLYSPGVTSIGVTAFVLLLIVRIFVPTSHLPRIYLYCFCIPAYWLLSPLPPQVRFVPSSLGWWQHIYPIVASATTGLPQGHYISDSGDSRTRVIT